MDTNGFLYIFYSKFKRIFSTLNFLNKLKNNEDQVIDICKRNFITKYIIIITNNDLIRLTNNKMKRI